MLHQKNRSQVGIGRTYKAAISTSAFALVSVLSAAPALSQADPVGAAESNENEATARLDTITVTSRKREESLQDVPVVVSAFGEDTIDAFGVSDVANIASLVPGLSFDVDAATNPNLNLRGIQSDAVNVSVESSVSLNVDGVPSANLQVMRASQFDIQRVEVLKGPQALFFGKNSPGGIVSIATADPTEDFYLELTAGNEFEAERLWTEAVVSNTLDNGFGYRFAGRWTEATDGFYENQASNASEDGPQFENYTLRGVLTYENDKFDVSAKVTKDKYEANQNYFPQIAECDLFEAIAGPGAVASLNPNTDCTLNDTFALPESGAADDLFQPFYSDRDRPYSDFDVTMASLEANYALSDNITLTSVTGYSKINNDRSVNVLPYDFGDLLGGGLTANLTSEDEHTSLTQEFRLTGDMDRVRYMLGAFIDDRSIDTLNGGNFFTLTAPFFETGQDSDSWSVFAQVETDLTEQWTLSVGGRYTDETKEYKGEIRQEVPAFPSLMVGSPITPSDAKLEETDFSPEVTLTYKPNDDVLLFGSYKEGFKSGGFNQSTIALPAQQEAALNGIPFNLSFRPESVEGFEGGAKTQWLDDTLRVNIVGFDYEYSDLQLAAVNPVTLASETLNAGAATVQGIELEMAYVPPKIEGLTLTSSLVYQNARYDDYISDCNASQLASNLPSAISPVSGQFPGCDIDLNNDTIPDSQQRAGDPLRRAPDWVGVLGFNYEKQFGSGIGFRTNWNATWTDEYQTNSDNDPRAIQDAFWLLNGSVGIFAEDNSWNADLIVRNLNDEIYRNVSGVLTGTADFGGPFITTLGSPREVMVRFTVRPSVWMAN